ncbi:MAG: polysaccharide deacetylase family protein [Firmicutes bacterium]|nr:polysaccharide deacetylase family protein [Bacillota bacterium]
MKMKNIKKIVVLCLAVLLLSPLVYAIKTMMAGVNIESAFVCETGYCTQGHFDTAVAAACNNHDNSKAIAKKNYRKKDCCKKDCCKKDSLNTADKNNYLKQKSLDTAALTSCFLTNSTKNNEHIIDWGLVPNDKGIVPQPPDGAALMLKNNNGIYVGDTTKSEVFLTFDLGYEAGFTGQVLDILKQNDIKAIFFLCGHYIQKESDLTNKMIADGHIIGNHTNKHKDLPTLDNDLIKRDIAEFKQMYENAYTAPVVHFRPPSGRISERVLKEASAQGLKTVMWSSAIKDWGKQPIDSKKCADTLTKRAHNGNIILLHISNAGTPPMLEILIKNLKEKGFSFGDATKL